MKPFRILPLLLAAATPAWSQETVPAPDPVAVSTDTFQPKEYSVSRYEKMREKSPFEFELAAPPAPEEVNPFEGLSLAGFVGGGNAMTVYLVDAKSNERTSVYGDGTGRDNESGIRIISVNRGPVMSKTTVTLEKNGRTQELGFAEGFLGAMTGGAAGGAGGAAPQPGGVVVPGQQGQPANRVNLPNTRGVVRPGGQPTANVQSQPYQAPAAFIAGRTGVPQQGIGQTGIMPAPAVNGQQPIINQLLNARQNADAAAGQPAVIIPQAGTSSNTQSGNSQNQPRRRVVLPSR